MIVELNSFICPNDIGSKAKSLVDLNRYGYKTPKAIVIDTKEYDKIIKNIKDKIERLFEKLQFSNIEFISKQIKSLFENVSISEKVLIDLQRFINKNNNYILRVSLEGIDDNNSYAGIYPTRQNINLNNIEENILECYKSLFSHNSLYYMLKNKIDYKNIKLGIIIQEHIKEECIGYARSINPVTLNTKEISLILSKDDIKEHYTYDISTKNLKIESNYKIITKKKLLKVFDLLVDVQLNFGYPIETELAITKSDIYVIQVRKITSILYNNLDIIYKESATSSKKLLFDLFAQSYNGVISKYYKEYVHNKKVDNNVEIMFNKSYYNLINRLDIIDSITKISDDYLLKYNIKYKNGLLKNIRRYLNKRTYDSKLININNNFCSFNDEYNKLYSSYCKKISKLNSNNTEKEWVELITNDYKKLNDLYLDYKLVTDIEKNKLYQLLKDYISIDEFNTIISKKEELCEYKIDKELNKIVYKINADEKSYRYWFSTSTLKILKNYEEESKKYYHPEFRKFIDSYGYLTYFKVDLSEKFYVEDTEEVIRDIKKRLAHPIKPINYVDERENIMEKIKSTINHNKYQKLEILIDNIQNLTSNKDTIYNFVLKFNFIIKRYTKMLSKIYLNKKVITDENDIWYIDLQKILDYIDGEVDPLEIKNSIDKNKNYFNSFRNFSSEKIIGSIKENIKKYDCQGTGMSSNITTGKVRMIKNIADLETLTSEDILVTKNINNNLLFQLPNVKGIIVSYENIDSCCQNIIREMHIPFIYLENSSKKLTDNSIIKMDGYTGKIKIVRR